MNTIKEKLRQQYKCPIWTSLDGTMTPITLMTLRHLNNCQRHIQERIAAELTSAWAMPAPQGEVAGDLWDDYLESGQADDEQEQRRHDLHAWKRVIESE